MRWSLFAVVFTLATTALPTIAQQNWGNWRSDTGYDGVLIRARCGQDNGSVSTWEWQLKSEYPQPVRILYRVEENRFEEYLQQGNEGPVRGLNGVLGGCNRGGIRIAVDSVQRTR